MSESLYSYETYSSESSDFNRSFTGYLNGKYSEGWKVKSCSFCHDPDGGKMWASCLFKVKKKKSSS